MVIIRNMMKYILGLGTLAIIGLPFTALAATYFYVDTTGNVGSVEAPNANQALELTASVRDIHSGVTLDQGYLEGDEYISVDNIYGTGGPVGLTTYQYVDIHGDVQFVAAIDADQALALAVNIAPHSGVVLTGAHPIDPDVEIPGY